MTAELVEAAERLSFAQLGVQVSHKFSDVTHSQGALYFPCPLCNERACLLLDAHESGDAVWCLSGCEDDSKVDAAVRFLIQRLPARCTDHNLYPSRNCSRCVAWGVAAQHAYRHLNRGGAEQVEQDIEPVFSSLTKASPVPVPTILRLPDGTFLLRKGWVHWIHGKGGSGKTPLAYMAAVEVTRAGGHVLIVDHEMGEAGALDLLRDLAPELTDEQIDSSVRYMYEKPLHTEHIKLKALSELDGFEPDLVIVDAVTGSMTDGSQYDAADVNRWFRAVPQWLRDQFGAAVVVIDHSNRDDGPMPSGSARKHGAPEFRVWVRLVRDFNPDHEDGCSLLEVRKERGRHARTGKVLAELRTVKGGSFVLRAVGKSPIGADHLEVDLGTMPQSHQVRIDVLERLRATGEAGSMTKDIAGDSGGADYQTRTKALKWLVEHGRVECRKEPGTSRGRRYWAKECFPGDPDE